MIAVIYLLISFFAGSAICRVAFPGLQESCSYSYKKVKIKLSAWFVLLPAWFLTGIIVQTWVTYLATYFFRDKAYPLSYGNAVSMTLFLVGTVCYYYFKLKKKENCNKIHIESFDTTEWVILCTVCFIAFTLMWKTFCVRDGSLYVGYSVFSDFSPHLGMIRSFSYGNNFPTTYSFFAGEDIKYHFMFQFLVGNLEFLGMRIDYAFNLPSMLGFVSTVMLFYAFVVKLTGKKAVACFSVVFFLFRSSFSVFRFIIEREPGIGIFQALAKNTQFIGYTTNEHWGLWNLNVYSNQRHLGFTLGVLLFVLMQFLPHLYEGVLKDGNVKSFFSRKGWEIKDLRLALCCGIFLGSIGFWNGAVTIAALLVLFGVAILADRRLEFLVVAVIAVTLTLLQSKFFIHGSAVELSFEFGFIAEEKSLSGVLGYIGRLTGILPFALAASLLIIPRIQKYLILAFSFPFLFSFFVSLTPDVTVNHKYIMISVMLLSIFAADLVVRLLEQRQMWKRALAVFLVFLMTATGLYDYRTLLKVNENALVFSQKDPLTLWVKENATSQDIFLTHNYSLNSLVLGGAMLYDGWQYFAWSAGYDTEGRDELVRQMYEADSPETLIRLIEQNNIRFIVVDNEARNAIEYEVNEEIIAGTYEMVFHYNDNGSDTIIYDTKRKTGNMN